MKDHCTWFPETWRGVYIGYTTLKHRVDKGMNILTAISLPICEKHSKAGKKSQEGRKNGIR
jgi:hypothetical protein